jgi:hypothetical protein
MHKYDYYRNLTKGGMTLLGDDKPIIISNTPGSGGLFAGKNLAMIAVGLGLAYLWFNRNQTTTTDPVTGQTTTQTTQLAVVTNPVFIATGDATKLTQLANTLIAVFGDKVIATGYSNTSNSIAFQITDENGNPDTEEENYYIKQAQALGLSVTYGSNVNIQNTSTGTVSTANLSTNSVSTQIIPASLITQSQYTT